MCRDRLGSSHDDRRNRRCSGVALLAIRAASRPNERHDDIEKCPLSR